MNPSRRDAINTFADNVRKVLNLEVPVDMQEAVELLKGEIKYLQYKTDKEAKIEKVSEPNIEFRITLPQYTSVIRDRFTIAHELGHLFIHMGYLVDEEKWKKNPTYEDSAYYRFGHSKEEYEANEFAAAFLMPKKEFFEVSKSNYNNGKYNISAIADHFKVSLEAVRNRGRWLGLFSWE